MLSKIASHVGFGLPGFLVTIAIGLASLASAADELVPVGVARIDITPVEPIRLTGYARAKPKPRRPKGVSGPRP